MNEPRCIAQFLRNHQASRPMDFSITHGKGRKGIIIRQPRRYDVASAFQRCLKVAGRIFK
ncbi:hypothetical protein FH968_12705 [Buttiauxella sp. B2]|uniref:hypothetical protein n=1 Tax=Buttiauxella sp. B2 TaxID=2587812 RepID=UPI00111CB1A5|nr:hypothetical protein [Buttiauxella sp. B2]TNV19707.1 hypothetical protein FH968_12705 [Buttiauxella sp. B2]